MAVWAEDNAIDRTFLADQAVEQLGVVGCVDFNDLVASHAGHCLPIWAEGGPQEFVLGFGEGLYLPRWIGGEVPEACCFILISSAQQSGAAVIECHGNNRS